MSSNSFLFDIDRKRALYYGLSAIAVGVCGVFCASQIHKIHNKRKLINFYRDNRRMINVGIKDDHLPSLRVMSYNILADGTKYALKEDYNYTPYKYRKWNYRKERILSEIEAYKPDIIGLQETTYTTYHNSLSIEFDLMGYESIHIIRDENGHKFGFHGTTDTIIFNKNKFKLLNKKIIRLNNECDLEKYDKYFGDKQSYFRSKALKRCPDILIVLHLKFKQFDNNKSNEFIASTTHLHWNPKQPQIKLAQTLMINESLNDLITNQWNLNINQIPMICCGDFNALPIKNKPDRYDPYLNEEKGDSMISGVYQLMTQCHVHCDHEDHPKKRIYEKIYRSIYYERLREENNENKENDENIINEKEEKTEQEIIAEKRGINIKELSETIVDIEKYPQLIELQYIRDLNDYKTNIRWKSVYGTASDEPIWTNHVPHFSATIDYIFVNDNFRILSYLEHPSQNNLSYHIIDLNAMNNPMINNQNNNPSEEQQFIKLEKQKEIENAKNFKYLPNKDYVSDHLCIVADLQFMPTPQQIHKIIQTLES